MPLGFRVIDHVRGGRPVEARLLAWQVRNGVLVPKAASFPRLRSIGRLRSGAMIARPPRRVALPSEYSAPAERPAGAGNLEPSAHPDYVPPSARRGPATARLLVADPRRPASLAV